MKKEQRWSQIVEYCKSNPSASVDDLVNYLHVSAATVRRDLSEMEEQNMIVRYHGGARINSDQYNEPSMILKTEANIPAKKLTLLAIKNILNERRKTKTKKRKLHYQLGENNESSGKTIERLVFLFH